MRQGNVFTPVCHSVHGGRWLSASVHAGIHTPLGRTHPRKHTPAPPPPKKHLPEAHSHPPETHSPGSTPPGKHPSSPRRSLQRTVRILLECFLVLFLIAESSPIQSSGECWDHGDMKSHSGRRLIILKARTPNPSMSLSLCRNSKKSQMVGN